MRLRIFTDGACSDNPGPGGWAVVFCKNDKCKTFSGYDCSTTNNRMELISVIESFKEILKLERKENQNNIYELFSDSAYVVNSINNGWLQAWAFNGWKTTRGDEIKNQDLWQEFLKLQKKIKAKNINITIIKVKGHAGNSFNELADAIAKAEVAKAKESI